ncbi:MAG: hypothetical protein ACRDQ4_04560 [Pseudonocardiaceae bacterium]
MLVDCDRCAVRGGACQDCVITVLLGAPPGGVELDGTQRRALDTLAEAGLVPRLQLVDRHGGHPVSPTGTPTGTDTGAHLRKDAERRAADGERSRRYVS